MCVKTAIDNIISKRHDSSFDVDQESVPNLVNRNLVNRNLLKYGNEFREIIWQKETIRRYAKGTEARFKRRIVVYEKPKKALATTPNGTIWPQAFLKGFLVGN